MVDLVPTCYGPHTFVYSKCVFLMPVTYDQRTCASHLVQETCMHVCWSILYFLYKFLARNCTQLYSNTETLQHLTWTVQRNWPASCYRLFVIGFRLFSWYIYVFSFHKDLKMAGTMIKLTDFMQKDVCVQVAVASTMFSFIFNVQNTVMKNKNLRQIFHASFLYKTCTNFWSATGCFAP